MEPNTPRPKSDAREMVHYGKAMCSSMPNPPFVPNFYHLGRLSLLIVFIAILINLYRTTANTPRDTERQRAKETMSLLKFLTVPARAKHSATVIFVHVCAWGVVMLLLLMR